MKRDVRDRYIREVTVTLSISQSVLNIHRLRNQLAGSNLHSQELDTLLTDIQDAIRKEAERDEAIQSKL